MDFSLQKNRTYLDHPIFTALLCICMVLAAGILVIMIGQDASWDLKNYHFYNPFAFISGRMAIDIVPAQKQTFFNPAIDIPLYFAITNLKPQLVGFLYGAVQGFNWVLLYLIAKQVVDVGIGRFQNWTLVSLVTICGMGGYISLSQLGISSGDTIVSIPLLASVLLVASGLNPSSRSSSRAIFIKVIIAGGLAGVASALKLTCAPFSAAALLAFLFINEQWIRKLKLMLFFSLGSAIGFSLAGGFWFAKLYLFTGNPFFPYFNNLFQSPVAFPSDYRDMRFMVDGFIAKLAAPITALINPQQFSEVPFRDGRLLAFALACIAYFWATHSGKWAIGSKKAQEQYLFWFLGLGYIIWLNLFCIYRYLSVLEFLCPVIVAITIFQTIKHRRIAYVICCTVLVLLIFTTNFRFHHRTGWGDSYFGVEIPSFPGIEKSYVLMAGNEPMSYLIPFFPESTKFMRIQSNITGKVDKPSGFDQLMRQTINQQDPAKPLFVLLNEKKLQPTMAVLKSYNLQIDHGRSKKFRSRIQPESNGNYILCPLKRIDDELT